MASGQQRVVWNNGERAISDDNNKQGDFIARQRNEILRSLCQLDAVPGSPGITNLNQSATDDYPLDGIVLDGLEAIVDTPGYVMITPGTLAGWVGQPGDPGQDSGWMVVPSSGLSELRPEMVIVENNGTVPRCDIIEVRFNATEVATVEDRDIYNPASESFVPAIVTKTTQVVLQFRVRTGTPGVPPNGDYGWLPLTLAIVQPGLPVSMVDFYDVRPLLRDMQGRARTLDAMNGNSGALINRGSNHQVQASTTDGTIPHTTLFGVAQAEFNGMRMEGYLTRNTPITPASQANWGLITTGVGGDGYGIALGSDVFVRGTATVIGPYTDQIVIAACFPRLAFNNGTVPRCVRYTQSAVNNHTLTPARRRPQGINGIILAFSKNQEASDFTNGGLPFTASALNADGFAGCVGGALCYPLGSVAVDNNGYVFSEIFGMCSGAHVIDGMTYITNVPVYASLFTGLIDLSTDAAYEDETPGLAIPHATFEDPLSLAGDSIEIELTNLFFMITGTTSSAMGGIHVIVTEDYYGTPVVHTFPQWFRCYVDNSPLIYPINAKIPLTLTRGGTLRVELRLYNSGSANSESRIQSWSNLNNWGTYRRYR
jgi:hypothetical protein